MANTYKPSPLTWHLVLVPTIGGLFIHGVYGAALLECAEDEARVQRQHGGFIRSLCSYGMAYKSGEIFHG